MSLTKGTLYYKSLKTGEISIGIYGGVWNETESTYDMQHCESHSVDCICY